MAVGVYSMLIGMRRREGAVPIGVVIPHGREKEVFQELWNN